MIMAAPKSITRATYMALIESLGLDPSKVIRMSFSADGIFAEVFAEPGDKEIVLFEQGEFPRKPVRIMIEG